MYQLIRNPDFVVVVVVPKGIQFSINNVFNKNYNKYFIAQILTDGFNAK